MDEVMDDIAMINEPNSWPVFPVLPMKNLNTHESAILTNQGEITLYKINMFELTEGLLEPQLRDVERVVYPDAQAVVDDGWIVD